MGLTQTARLHVEDRSAIGAARALVRELGPGAGLDEDRLSSALIVASELATNLVLHAGQGSFVVRARAGQLVVLTWDRGPGIPDLAAAERDGFSTAGTAGTGLGAVRRLSDAMEVRSARGQGTLVAAWFGDDAPQLAEVELDGLALPLGGTGPSGDAFAARRDGAAVTVLMADGLGHGPDAAHASQRAVDCLQEGADRAPRTLLEAMHRALTGTRGAAVGIARLEPERGTLSYAATGNIAATCSGPSGQRGLIGGHGIVGREQRRVTETTYPLGPKDTVILHTDGVRGSWNPTPQRGMVLEHPLLIAAAMLRDNERGRDDAAVVVARLVGRT